MRKAIVILCVVFALIGAADANAHLIAKPKCHSMKCREASQLENLKHARYVCHHGGGQNKQWSCAAVKWLKREFNRTEAKLHPRPTRPAHYAGWSCITNGAYPGAPHEGNGYNGAYTGPLGMSTPWAGHYPTGSDWVHTPVAIVYSLAEQVAARNHFSYSWMAGQWPNTFPPCARFF